MHSVALKNQLILRLFPVAFLIIVGTTLSIVTLYDYRSFNSSKSTSRTQNFDVEASSPSSSVPFYIRLAPKLWHCFGRHSIASIPESRSSQATLTPEQSADKAKDGLGQEGEYIEMNSLPHATAAGSGITTIEAEQSAQQDISTCTPHAAHSR